MDNSLTEVINRVLDEVCQEEDLNEQELASRYDVSRVTIWRWRQGEVGKAADTLIPLILKKYKSLLPATQ